MTALAELQTADLLGRLLTDDEVLEPVAISEPMPWGRVIAWTATGAVLGVWAWLVLSLFVQQWRGA